MKALQNNNIKPTASPHIGFWQWVHNIIILKQIHILHSRKAILDRCI